MVEYEKLKDLEVAIIIKQKNETTFEEIYTKGSLNLKHIIHLTGKTKIELEDGTTIKVRYSISFIYTYYRNHKYLLKQISYC